MGENEEDDEQLARRCFDDDGGHDDDEDHQHKIPLEEVIDIDRTHSIMEVLGICFA
jgi:hypothetical protein